MHSLSEVLYMECTPLNVAVVLVTTGAVRSNLANNRLATFPGLPEGSLYARYLPNIIERVGMSQGADSMPTDEYARRVVRSTLQGRPPRQMRLGGKTLLYRVLQWLPRGFVLWLMWRRFSRGTK